MQRRSTMIPGAGNDLRTDLEARQVESTSTMRDLRSSHRMLKTSCIIFLPLGLTCLIATLSLAYIAAAHDRRAQRPPATSAAARHEAEVHYTSTIPRWVSEIRPVRTAPRKVIAAGGTAETSLSPFYDREEDVIYFRNLTRDIATAPTIGPSNRSAKGGWLVVAATSETSMAAANQSSFATSTIGYSAHSPEAVFTAPTTRSFEPAGRRLDVDSLDNEDLNDIGDRADHGEHVFTSKNSATRNQGATKTTDLLDLLGLLDTLSPNVSLSGSSKRAQSSKRRVAGRDGARRRYPVGCTASRIASWVYRNTRKMTSKLPGAKLTYEQSSWQQHLNERNRSLTRRGEMGSDKIVRKLLPSTFVTMTQRKPRDALVAQPRKSPKRPRSGENFLGARSVTRIVIGRHTPRRRNDGRSNGNIDASFTHAIRFRARRLPLFKRSTTTTEENDFVSTEEDNSASFVDLYG
ncbi:uncharacterized protein [Dermacentor albipictus]|uniref:uncharacterized protein n=1 Tax=Dermacentor albipictus TaxID=60249 RepID=UPI0038FCD68F